MIRRKPKKQNSLDQESEDGFVEAVIKVYQPPQEKTVVSVAHMLAGNPICSKFSLSPDVKQDCGVPTSIEFAITQSMKIGSEIFLKGYGKITERDTLLHMLFNRLQQFAIVYFRFRNQLYCSVQDSPKFACGYFYPMHCEMQPQKKKRIQNFDQQMGYSTQFQSVQQISKEVTQSSQFLQFVSKFQSGNLLQAWVTGPNQYTLLIQNDTNSKGYNQWFFFGVKGMVPNRVYTFTITKNSKLFKNGMKPLFSGLNSGSKRTGWEPLAKNVQFYQSKCQKEGGKGTYCTLRFSVQLECQYQLCMFSQAYPYTFTKLKSFIKGLSRSKIPFYKQSILQNSINDSELFKLEFDSPTSKEVVIVLARQHPGQSMSSFVLEGLLEGLLLQHKQLRKKYKFVVFPMVNPDGVTAGNYRCNLAGFDLNRKWNNPSRQLHPEVYHIKQNIKEIAKKSRVFMVIDLHGHLKKTGAFFYCNPFPYDSALYPFLVSKLSPRVDFKKCTFSVSESKRNSARVQLSEMLKGAYVYTLETSFFGYEQEGRVVPFTPKECNLLGRDLVAGLEILSKINEGQRMKLIQDIENLAAVAEEREESGSDSDPQEGQLTAEEYLLLSAVGEPRKRKTHTRYQSRGARLTARRLPQNNSERSLLGVSTVNVNFGRRVLELPIKNSFNSYRIRCYNNFGVKLRELESQS